jgi:hypothetical protein
MVSKTPIRRTVLLGTPLALSLLMLLHPSPYDDVAGELVPIAGSWTVLHTVQFVLFALMGWAVWLLVDGLSGVAATVSRVAAAVFVLFYDVGDAVAGIATGILAGSIAGAPAGERAGLVAAVEALFADPTKNLAFAMGIYAWVFALVAAGVALRRAGAPLPPLLLLALPAFFMTFDYAFPYGSLTFASFFIVALWLEVLWRGGTSLDAGSGARRLNTTEPA